VNSTRFVIYTQGRTGSSLLASLLNHHPQICCFGELFHPNAWRKPVLQRLLPIARRFPIRYLALRGLLARRPVVGFKLLVGQDRNLNNLTINLWNRGWPVISLQHRDLFARSLSAAMLRVTGISHRRTPTTEPLETDPIVIEPAFFEQILRKGLDYARLERETLAQIPHLVVTYEDDLAQPDQWQVTADGVFAYLGLPSCQVVTNLQRTYSWPYSELIANLDELAEIARQMEIT